MTLDRLPLLDAMDAAADLLRTADPNYSPADDELIFRRLQKERLPHLDRVRPLAKITGRHLRMCDAVHIQKSQRRLNRPTMCSGLISGACHVRFSSNATAACDPTEPGPFHLEPDAQ